MLLVLQGAQTFMAGWRADEIDAMASARLAKEKANSTRSAIVALLADEAFDSGRGLELVFPLSFFLRHLDH